MGNLPPFFTTLLQAFWHQHIIIRKNSSKGGGGGEGRGLAMPRTNIQLRGKVAVAMSHFMHQKLIKLSTN